MLLAVLIVLQVTSVFAASSARGARLFETQQCVRCHSVNGIGGQPRPKWADASDATIRRP